MRTTWEVRAIATLTDKDWAEINAFLAKYPNAKHQLCFWHCLCALKKQLTILRWTPAFYDVIATMKEFSFIEENFVPIEQLQTTVSTDDSTTWIWLPLLATATDRNTRPSISASISFKLSPSRKFRSGLKSYAAALHPYTTILT